MSHTPETDAQYRERERVADARAESGMRRHRPQVSWAREDDVDGFEARAAARSAVEAINNWGADGSLGQAQAALGYVRRMVRHAFAARGLPVPPETEGTP